MINFSHEKYVMNIKDNDKPVLFFDSQCRFIYNLRKMISTLNGICTGDFTEFWKKLAIEIFFSV